MKKSKIKKSIFLFFGFLFYLNYRAVYAFMLHKKVMDFREFCLSKDRGEAAMIFYVDVSIVAYLLFGFWISVIISLGLTALNIIVLLLNRKKLNK